MEDERARVRAFYESPLRLAKEFLNADERNFVGTTPTAQEFGRAFPREFVRRTRSRISSSSRKDCRERHGAPARIRPSARLDCEEGKARGTR